MQERTKKLEILKTVIGAYNLNIEGELHTFSVLYSGAMVPWYEGEMLFLPEDLYKTMLREFLNGRGSDYITPSVTEIAKDRATAINNYNNGMYIWEDPNDKKTVYVEKQKEAPIKEEPAHQEEATKTKEETPEEKGDEKVEVTENGEETKMEQPLEEVKEEPIVKDAIVDETAIEEPNEFIEDKSKLEELADVPNDFEDKFIEKEKDTNSDDEQEVPVEIEKDVEEIEKKERPTLSDFKQRNEKPNEHIEEKPVQTEQIKEKVSCAQNDELNKVLLSKINELNKRLNGIQSTNDKNANEIRKLANNQNKQENISINTDEIQNLIFKQNKIIEEQKNAINQMNQIIVSQKKSIDAFQGKIDKTQKMEKVRVKKTWAIMIIGVILMVAITICTQLFLPKAENSITLDPNADAEVHVVVHEDDGTDSFQRIGTIKIQNGKIKLEE